MIAGRITRSGSGHEKIKDIEPRINADERRSAFIRANPRLKKVCCVIGDADGWWRNYLIDLLWLFFALRADQEAGDDVTDAGRNW